LGCFWGLGWSWIGWDLGGLLGSVLVFCPVADVGSAQVIGDLGGRTSGRLFWFGIGLGILALLEFGDGFADALGDVGEGFVLVGPLGDRFDILIEEAIPKVYLSVSYTTGAFFLLRIGL
jgi:hypothetical protein